MDGERTLTDFQKCVSCRKPPSFSATTAEKAAYNIFTLSIPYQNNLILLACIVVEESPEYNKMFTKASIQSNVKRENLKVPKNLIFPWKISLLLICCQG